jgi:hypothetical protein
MAIVKKVEKRVVLPKWDLVKYQILTHCYIHRITVSDSDLNCLTLLSINGPSELTDFCYDASEEHNIFKSSQTVRNSVNKCEKKGLVEKDPDNKKIVTISKGVKIETEGSILLDYKFFAK